MSGSCEHGNETPVSVKCRDIIVHYFSKRVVLHGLSLPFNLSIIVGL
jgi:hypothetical protein